MDNASELARALTPSQGTLSNWLQSRDTNDTRYIDNPQHALLMDQLLKESGVKNGLCHYTRNVTLAVTLEPTNETNAHDRRDIVRGILGFLSEFYSELPLVPSHSILQWSMFHPCVLKFVRDLPRS